MTVILRLLKWLIAAGLIVSGLILVVTGLHLSVSAWAGAGGEGLVTRSAHFILAQAQYPVLAAYPVPAGVLLLLCGLLLFAV